MDKTISATDAVRTFSEILNSIKYRGDRYTIVRGGKPVALLCPVETPVRERTLAELKALLHHVPRLGEEAERFDKDLREITTHQLALPEPGRWG